MAFQWKMGWVGLAALVGVGLQGCAATHHQRSEHHASRRASPGSRGGGDEEASVNLLLARQQCEREARDVRGYPGATAGMASVTGPEKARVQVNIGAPASGYRVPCTYDARSGVAHVP
ncbi:hypothetical protein [Stigmatella aurantiaca]|uniref:Lipoprotein n=1 Tax=Stigmatella aurantiaca (strain DW4/3-1) TaxID=378806 RepID=E3FZ87_STIAD|nr:hypothetical protein [Stigmatella aurantiaca]ADO74904.1 uncharacterized protein STAUR_7148 [Stigmatella aurantiaca DW4/3-1]